MSNRRQFFFQLSAGTGFVLAASSVRAAAPLVAENDPQAVALGYKADATKVDKSKEEEDRGAESRDDFLMLFVGPNPAAIMQVQRDLLVQDVVNMMERHFDGSELGGVVAEIDKLFSQRFDDLVNSLEIGRPPHGSGGSGHGGGRRPRHLH